MVVRLSHPPSDKVLPLTQRQIRSLLELGRSGLLIIDVAGAERSALVPFALDAGTVLVLLPWGLSEPGRRRRPATLRVTLEEAELAGASGRWTITLTGFCRMASNVELPDLPRLDVQEGQAAAAARLHVLEMSASLAPFRKTRVRD